MKNICFNEMFFLLTECNMRIYFKLQYGIIWMIFVHKDCVYCCDFFLLNKKNPNSKHNQQEKKFFSFIRVLTQICLLHQKSKIVYSIYGHNMSLKNIKIEYEYFHNSMIYFPIAKLILVLTIYFIIYF